MFRRGRFLARARAQIQFLDDSLAQIKFGGGATGCRCSGEVDDSGNGGVKSDGTCDTSYKSLGPWCYISRQVAQTCRDATETKSGRYYHWEVGENKYV